VTQIVTPFHELATKLLFLNKGRPVQGVF
jgi:hypothetical protein